MQPTTCKAEKAPGGPRDAENSGGALGGRVVLETGDGAGYECVITGHESHPWGLPHARLKETMAADGPIFPVI